MTSGLPARGPEVTVVMAVYNGEAYVGEAVQSILDQTHTNLELVVVDDGSTDRTAQILSGFSDSRVRVFRNEQNQGITRTRNRAMSEALGEFIAVLDSDDLSSKERLKVQSNFLRENPDHAMVASWAQYINEDGSVASGMPIWRVPLPNECAASILLFQNFICHSSVMLRAAMLPEPVYQHLEPSEDYDLWVRLAQSHQIEVIPEVLVRYRLHDQNVSKTRESRQKETSFIIVTDQLERLGINASPAELELHHKMFWDSSFQNRKAVVEIRVWLDKILNANRRTQVYDESSLEKAAAYQWTKACLCACTRNRFLLFPCGFYSLGARYRFGFIVEATKIVLWKIKAMVTGNG